MPAPLILVRMEGLVLDLFWTHSIYVPVIRTKTEFIVKVSIVMVTCMDIYLSYICLRYLFDKFEDTIGDNRRRLTSEMKERIGNTIVTIKKKMTNNDLQNALYKQSSNTNPTIKVMNSVAPQHKRNYNTHTIFFLNARLMFYYYVHYLKKIYHSS